eukprot:Sspe_Gene.5266::Locus_1732_Transcript_1_1_Confidence_1.000_Length_1102::g.5266::m.5266
MRLMYKMLHTVVYNRVKEKLLLKIRERGFQWGGDMGEAQVRVVVNAQRWVLEDPMNVVLVTDLLAAYDRVRYDRLEEVLGGLLDVEEVNSIMMIVRSQRMCLALRDGATEPERLERGLIQGSALSVICSWPTQRSHPS